VEREAMYINRSLSFLEQVVVALSDSSREHIPFRQSKLTHFLRDSLGGNSHTVLIANVWAEEEQIPETLSTLRFASRVQCIHTNPMKNTLKDPQLLLKEYEKEILTLKKELAMHNTLLNRGPVSYDALSELEVEELKQQVESFLNGALPDIELVSVKQVKEVFAQFKALALSLESTPRSPEHPSGPCKTAPTVPQSTSRTKRESKSRVQPEALSQTVGETQGAGLGLGIAPASLRHPESPATAMKKSKVLSKSDSKRKESMASSRCVESPPPDEELAPSEIERPSTPPLKEEAFEDFKKQRGSEINRVFLENKATMHLKKKEASELCASINTIKRKIDELQSQLPEAEMTGGERGGPTDEESEEAETVVEEWQFNCLTELKELKTSYREQYKKFQLLQQEVGYCSQYVAQSRCKLVEEFETWYIQGCFCWRCD
jgi:kinesin family protein 6/9